MRLIGYRNAEAFVEHGAVSTRFVTDLQRFHATHGGHTELRQSRNLLGIDMAFRGPIPAAYFALLEAHKMRPITWHQGKYVPLA